MPGRPARLATLLSLALVLLGGEARAQTAPLPDGGRRVLAADEWLSHDAQAKLEETIAAIESERAPRRFFVVVLKEGPLLPFAHATVQDWSRRAGESSEVSWRPESSFLIVAAPGNEDCALEAPPAQRDQLGLSPFVVRDELTGPFFAAAARRNDLAGGLEKLVEALSGWLAEADAQLARERLAQIDEGDGEPHAPVAEPVKPVAERLRGLEARTFELESRGVDLAAVEAHLLAARKGLRSLRAGPGRGEGAARRARHVHDEMDSAGTLLEREESDRQAVLDHAERVRDSLERARHEIEGPSVELDRAKLALTAAMNEVMRRPGDARRSLYEAENALVRAHPAVVAVQTPGPPAPPTSWRRVLLALVALVLVFAVGLISVARATRAEARAAYLARRDEVARDARDLREIFEKLRTRRDTVAHGVPVAIPGSLAQELALASGAEETFTLPAPPTPRGDTERYLVDAGNELAEIGAAWDSGERALEAAHRRTRRGSILRAEPFLRARHLLDLVPERRELEPAIAGASAMLDRLAAAPEDARSSIADMWTHVQRARGSLDAAPRSSVSPVAFEEELAAALDLAADATFAATTDPVRALRASRAAKEAALALEAAIERALATQLEMTLVADAIARVERSLDPASPNGQDPRGACERARGSLAEAGAALELGAPDEAERELGQARAHLALAEEMLARSEEARRTGVTTVEQRRAEAKEARAAMEKARLGLETIEKDFAPESAADVRPVFDAAAATLPGLDAALEELSREEAPLASPQAHARLLRLDAHVTELDRAAHTVERRLQLLRDTKEQLKERALELERRTKELEAHSKQEDVALRTETLERSKALRAALERVAGLVRGDAPRPDVLALAREVDSVEGELEETRLDVARDAFLCRRVLSARKAAEDATRGADDAIRRGSDRLSARARARRARELVEKLGQKITSPDADWQVVLEGYSCARRAARGARELGFDKTTTVPDVDHARQAALAAIRRAERWDAPLGRTDVQEARSFLQRAGAEVGSNESLAVDLFEKASLAADEAVRLALLAQRDRARAGERAARDVARTQRLAREALDRKRRLADSRRRAEWIERRFAKPAPEPAPADAPAA